MVQFSSVQSLSHVQLLTTPWTTWLYQFKFLLAMFKKEILWNHIHSNFLYCQIFFQIFVRFLPVGWVLNASHCSANWHFLVTNDADHFLIYLWVICVSSSVKCLFISLGNFLLGYTCFSYYFVRVLYIFLIQTQYHQQVLQRSFLSF